MPFVRVSFTTVLLTLPEAKNKGPSCFTSQMLKYFFTQVIFGCTSILFIYIWNSKFTKKMYMHLTDFSENIL